jgi:UDP-glucose-4-epimerase GalE
LPDATPENLSMNDAHKAVLVTGGAGYIGSHTCKALAKAGYHPVAYDNLAAGHRWSVRWGPLVEGDVADMDRVRSTLQQFAIGAVVHFAAPGHAAGGCRTDAASMLALLRAMQACGVRRFVFSSTCATYGMPQRLPLGEDEEQHPLNSPGEAKLAAEKILRWWGSAHGLRWMALRHFNAAGADPDGELGEAHEPETHLIPLAIEAAMGKRSHVEIFGTDYPTRDGTAVRDYTHVADLAMAHVQALRWLEAGARSTAFNLGTGTGHTVREVVAMVERISGRRIAVHAAPRRQGDAPELVARISRARRFLDWQPTHSSLDSIVRTAWLWHSLHHASVTRGHTPEPPRRGLAVVRRLKAAFGAS